MLCRSLALYRAREVNSTSVQKELFGQCGFTRVRVRDNRESLYELINSILSEFSTTLLFYNFHAPYVNNNYGIYVKKIFLNYFATKS